MADEVVPAVEEMEPWGVPIERPFSRTIKDRLKGNGRVMRGQHGVDANKDKRRKKKDQHKVMRERARIRRESANANVS